MPTWYPNRGKPPRNPDLPLLIEWANGEPARHTYTAKQLVWELRGQPFDIGRFARADGE